MTMQGHCATASQSKYARSSGGSSSGVDLATQRQPIHETQNGVALVAKGATYAPGKGGETGPSSEHGHCVIDPQGLNAVSMAGRSGRHHQHEHDAQITVVMPAATDDVDCVGLPGRETQPAVADTVNDRRQATLKRKARQKAKNSDTPLPLETLHALLGQYGSLYLDFQQSRIAMGNRFGSMKRIVGEEHTSIVADAHETLTEQEKDLARHIERLARRHPLSSFVETTHGIGWLSLALFLGVAGRLDRFKTVSKLWKYAGLSVDGGKAPRRVKGQAWTHTDCQFEHLPSCPSTCTRNHHPYCVPGGIGTSFNPRLRSIVIVYFGENGIIKQRSSPYRPLYDQKKAQYQAEHPDWTPLHIHNAARRYATKCLLRDLWIAWRAVVPAEGSEGGDTSEVVSITAAQPGDSSSSPDAGFDPTGTGDTGGDYTTVLVGNRELDPGGDDDGDHLPVGAGTQTTGRVPILSSGSYPRATD